jgi:hypothetical protein
MDKYLRDDLAAKGLDVQKLDETSRLGVLHVCVNHLCLNELAWLDCRKICYYILLLSFAFFVYTWEP